MLIETQIYFTLIPIGQVTKTPGTKVWIKSNDSKCTGIKPAEGKTEFNIQPHTAFYRYAPH